MFESSITVDYVRSKQVKRVQACMRADGGERGKKKTNKGKERAHSHLSPCQVFLNRTAESISKQVKKES